MVCMRYRRINKLAGYTMLIHLDISSIRCNGTEKNLLFLNNGLRCLERVKSPRRIEKNSPIQVIKSRRKNIKRNPIEHMKALLFSSLYFFRTVYFIFSLVVFISSACTLSSLERSCFYIPG